jgi:hypothetical protein
MTNPKLLKPIKSHPTKKKNNNNNMHTHSSCVLESDNTKCETPSTFLGGGINPTSKQKKLK